jgi:hypothetical protein
MKPFFLATLLLVLCIAAELAAILVLNSGHLVYTIDDPYIHLSLADGIRSGHYGVNPGEVSSPASSILWPFLLVPFSAGPSGHWAPFVINVACALATLFVFWRIIERALPLEDLERRGPIHAAVSILLVLATNTIGLVFVGMEHSLQLLLVGAIFWGLVLELETGSVRPWLIAAVLAAPLVRYENLAVSLAALLVLFLRGRRGLSTLLFSSVILLLGSFSVFLVSLGLPALPMSVLAKSHVASSSGPASLAANLLLNLRISLTQPRGIALAFPMVYFLAILLFAGERKKRVLAAAAALTVALHFAAGSYGWYHRYEVYAWAFALLAVFYSSREVLAGWIRASAGARGFLRPALLCACGLALLGAPYLHALATTPIASNNIYEQQYQMHRFAVEYYGRPVAVADLGYVSYRNPEYVLGLRGLGSPDVRELRRSREKKRWMDEAARAHDVRFAMIYERPFRDMIPDGWRKVGELHLSRVEVSTADSVVSFYALDEATYEETSTLIDRFKKSLPRGVRFNRDERED